MSESALTTVSDTLMSNWPMIVGVLLFLAALIIFAVLFYRNQMKKTATEEEDDDGESTCEKVRPEWDKFAAQWNGKLKNGVTIITNDVDCDQNEALANKYGVNGYPTVKCVMNNKITELDANPTFDTLNQFLESCFT